VRTAVNVAAAVPAAGNPTAPRARSGDSVEATPGALRPARGAVQFGARVTTKV
jgi:hypothetical protein